MSKWCVIYEWAICLSVYSSITFANERSICPPLIVQQRCETPTKNGYKFHFETQIFVQRESAVTWVWLHVDNNLVERDLLRGFFDNNKALIKHLWALLKKENLAADKDASSFLLLILNARAQFCNQTKKNMSFSLSYYVRFRSAQQNRKKLINILWINF